MKLFLHVPSIERQLRRVEPIQLEFKLGLCSKSEQNFITIRPGLKPE